MASPASQILTLPQERQSRGLSHNAHLPTDSVATSGSTVCTITAWCSSQSKRMACAPCFLPSSLLLHVRTPAHSCTPSLAPDKPRPLALRPPAPSDARPDSFSPLSSNSLCPQSANSLLLFSAFPFWVFQEDKEEEHTSVNSMFLGCLIKTDKIAEELRAGLAGVGSHALSSCCCFRLSCTSCFCPPCPQLGGSESGPDWWL